MAYCDECVELFGFEYSKYTALDDDLMELFYMMRVSDELCVTKIEHSLRRQEIGQVERFSKLEMTGSSDARDVCASSAKRALTFMIFLKEEMNRRQTDDSTQQRVGECLTQLLAFMGPLSDLEWERMPSLTRLHIAIHRELVEMIPLFENVRVGVIQSLDNNENLGYNLPTLSDGYVQYLMWDLTLVAVRIHSKVQLADYQKSRPLPSNDQRHLWQDLKRILTDKNGDPTPFWFSVLEILRQVLANPKTKLDTKAELDVNVYLIPPLMECNNVHGFCWWFLAHLVPELEQTDARASKPASVKIMSFAQSLLRTTLKQNGGHVTCPEPELRCYLRCLLRICDVMDVNVDVIISLWDRYFSKKLNESCSLPSFGLKAFADSGESKSASVWYSACQSRVRAASDYTEDENSFHLFLRLVALQIKRLPADSQGWRQLKSRVLLRCHQRSMNELNRQGLINFTSLFVTLAMLNDAEEMLEKLAAYYAMINSDKLTSDSKLVLVKSPFLALHLSADLGCGCEKIMAYAAETFSRVSKKFATYGPEFEAHHSLWTMVLVFLESACDLLDFGQKFEQLGKLFGHKYGETTVLSSITDTMRSCTKPEAKLIIDQLQNVLGQLCDAVTSGTRNVGTQVLSSSLWSCVYPHIREEVLRPAAPAQLADMAVLFTMMADRGTGSQLGHSAESCFTYFATHQDVQASVTCRYLCQVLSLSTMESLLTNRDALLIGAWIKCSLLAGEEARRKEMDSLNRYIENIPSMRPLLSPLAENRELGLPTLFSNLSLEFSRKEGFLERIEYRESVSRYFTMYQRYASTLVRQQVVPETVSRVLEISACLVEECSQLIYIKGKPNCLLPFLLDNLFLPHAVYDSSKPLPAYIVQPMQVNLPRFMRGLAVLDYKLDPYLKRAIGDTVCQYMTRFTLKAKPGVICNLNHPLVTAITDVGALDDDVIREFRLHILVCVVQNFIQKDKAAIGIHYYDRVVQKTTSRPLLASDCTVMITPLITYLLRGDDVTVKETVNAMLKTLLPWLQQYGPSWWSTVADQLKKFVLINARSHQLQVFRLLKPVSRLCPAALQPISADLADYVIMTEKNRGIKSTDTQLRQLCCDALRNLGPEAETDLKRLMETT